MTTLDRTTTTTLLQRICAGDVQAGEALTPVLYEELRSIARNLLRRERPGHTLQPTALVHEAYLKLIDADLLAAGTDQDAKYRFLGMAANAMRRVLIQHARQRHAEKRGGARQRLALDDLSIALPIQDETLLDLDEAIAKLQQVNGRLAQIAELRLFGGLSVRDLAPMLGVSLATAKTDWALARAWLSRLLQGHAASGPATG